jgi:enoyl-CoA hydratase/carnithine racemase
MNEIDVDVRDAVATVTLNRGKVNAINGSLVAQLDSAFRKLATNGDARAIVLTGHGKFFSFGFDVPELLSFTREQFIAFVREFTAFYTYLFLYPKPVVAAVNGHAVAGGCMLALAADRRIMTDAHATIGLNEIAFGSTAFAGSVEMLRFCVGDRAATEVHYSGALYTAGDARSLGLVDDVVAAPGVIEIARRMAEAFAKNLPAFASLKKLLRQPVAEEMRRREQPSIVEMAEIWYSPATWAKLHDIRIR